MKGEKSSVSLFGQLATVQHEFHPSKRLSISVKSELILYLAPLAVADPGFSPGGGGANSQNCYYFSHFCRKLHENERISTPGGARPWRPPLDPPMFRVILFIE